MSARFSTIAPAKACGGFCARPCIRLGGRFIDTRTPILPTGFAQLVHNPKLQKLKKINTQTIFIHRRFLI